MLFIHCKTIDGMINQGDNLKDNKHNKTSAHFWITIFPVNFCLQPIDLCLKKYCYIF